MMAKPKRYPFMGVRKENETKKIASMLKKVDGCDLRGTVQIEYLPEFHRTRIIVKADGYGKGIRTATLISGFDFSEKDGSFLKLALFKKAEEMSQFDFRETTNEEWSGIIADIIKRIRRGKM
ncbi:TPA: hypothetical protein ACKCFV_001729 [Streptococcus pneumoniae]